MGYYRRFIDRYVMIIKTLIMFLKNDTPPPQATLEALETFEKLKQSLLSTPILQTQDWEKLVICFSVASKEAMGATLAQLDMKRYDHFIYYASRQFKLAD